MKEPESAHARRDRLLGGLWGLLIGSAFGDVRARWLENPPATGSIRDRLPGASWSLEGAQILCLLMALHENEIPLEAMAAQAIHSARLGIYYPDGEFRFTELDGPLSNPTLLGQNHTALKRYQRHAIEQCALLFSLPLLWTENNDSAGLARRGIILGRDALRDGMDKAALVMGLMWGKACLEGAADAWEWASQDLLQLSSDIGITEADAQTVIHIPPGDTTHVQTHRMLYLLAHARESLQIGQSFDRAIDFAMAPRADLRIPMAFVGMMAGLQEGKSHIPLQCLVQLRGRELAKECIATCTPAVASDRNRRLRV